MATKDWRAWLSGLAGLTGGAAGGLIFTLGVVVARARIEGAYLNDLNELMGWVGLPLVLGPLVGAWIGAAHPPGRSVVTWSALGVVAGSTVGAALGAWRGEDPAGPWAGMIIGGATGLLLGVWTALLRHFRRRRRALEEGWELGPRRPIFVSLLAIALILGPLAVVVARAVDVEAPGATHVEPEPDPADVEAVILFVGDTGLARLATHPILRRLRADVERWAGTLVRDSAVVVVVLGDIVYPGGVAEPGALGWAEDSARVAEQVETVAGPGARQRGARAFFLAGNHDWGERRSEVGALRLAHLGDLLDSLAAAGPAVTLAPAAGTGGPQMVDIGEHLRLVLLDTAWWMLESDEEPRGSVLEGVSRALASAGGRRVVVAAHHPFRSAGPHGGLSVVGSTLGIRTLLSRSGALLQDLHSRPYVGLVRGLRAAFAEHGAPALFAGGHEHSIQVVRGASPDEPPVTLVSGSASKLSGVGPGPGVVFARSEPGFARLLVLRDGRLHLSIETVPEAYQSCTGADAERTRCMVEGVAAYRVVWSEEL